MGVEVTLDDCEREPIHIPGAVQPHGVLLACRADEQLTLVHVSANVSSMLGLDPNVVLGQSVLTLFEPAGHAFLRSLPGIESLREVNPHRLVACGKPMQATIHRSAELLVIELEPDVHRKVIGFDPRLRDAIMQLQGAGDVLTLCRVAASAVRDLTGFDRVMVYRFDESWNGEVVAEARADDLEPFLGLHYPASDIPVQARRLYTQNWIRLIADVGYTPAPLVPELDPATGQPLDLSHAHLRSVSPIHIEYLKNMGVSASMSVSLVTDGELLGLIACHYYSGPLVPRFSIRETAEYVGQALSWNISVLERADEAERTRLSREREAELARSLTGAEDLLSGLAVPALVELAGAGGAAVVLHEGTRCVGTTPDRDAIDALVAWLRASTHDMFATDCLSSHLPEAKAWEDAAAGLLAAPISAELGEWLLWFRPSSERTVNWAGDPRKETHKASHGAPPRLSPRGSFALWRELVQGRAVPWEKHHIDSASNVRRLMLSGVRRRAADLRTLNERLLDADRAKDVFIATISHELRTPLNAISGWSKMLTSGGVAPDRWQYAMEVISRNSDTLARLVEDLLDVSRIVGGKLELEIQSVDLAVLVNEIADSLQLSAQAKNLSFARNIEREPSIVLGDATRIRQVVTNLLGNAIKFTPKGGSIALALERIGSDVQISVSDDGPGIDAAELPHVFVAFWQADGSARRRTTGLGLGLAIAKKLVELHGGRIAASSDGLGRGARFEVTLPVVAVHKIVRTPAKPVDLSATQPLKGLKLLVVEDETDSRDLLATVLRGAGAEAHALTSAPDALALLARERFDAIVSDIGLPEMDGMQMLRALRAEGSKLHQPPAVALTAYTRAYDRTAALRAGFQAHVPKPVDPEELITVVESLVSRTV